MDKQQELEQLQKEVMEKAAKHLQAVRALPDDGEPELHLLNEAIRTRQEWNEVVERMNKLLEEMLREK
jgi:phosphohistidine phosphatase SixA